MVGIFIGIVVFVLILRALKKDLDEYNKQNKKQDKLGFGEFALSLLGAVLAFAIVDLLLFPVAQPTQTTKTVELVTTQKIVALQDNSSVDGSFFLGCGSIDSNDYYVFYVETENGYQREKLNAYSAERPTYVKYISADTETPHVDYYCVVSRETVDKEATPWLSITSYIKYNEYEVGDVVLEEASVPLFKENPDDYRIEIYVPEGSILENYNIDLK